MRLRMILGGVKIVSMTAGNVEDVAEIELECFSRPWSLASLTEELSNPLAVFLTALIDGKTVGYAGMHCVLDEGYVTNVAVLPKYRRKGVARALMKSYFEYADKNGLRIITLEVRESNAGARALYESLGFYAAGRRKNFYAQPAEDAIIMTKKF